MANPHDTATKAAIAEVAFAHLSERLRTTCTAAYALEIIASHYDNFRMGGCAESDRLAKLVRDGADDAWAMTDDATERRQLYERHLAGKDAE